MSSEAGVVNIVNGNNSTIFDVTTMPVDVGLLQDYSEVDVLRQYCDWLQLDVYQSILLLATWFVVMELIMIINSSFISSDKISRFYGSLRKVYHYGHFIILSMVAIRLVIYNDYIPIHILQKIVWFMVIMIVVTVLVRYQKIIKERFI